MADVFFNKAREEIATQNLNLTGSTLKVVLVNSSYVPGQTDLVVSAGGSDVASAEISVSGYTPGWGGSGRKTLANKVLSSTNGAVVPKLTADNIVWSSLGSGATIAGAVIIKEGVANDTTSRVIAYFGLTPTPTNGGDITLQWSASGLLTF
jgi:hypothetical protein